jgi:hypothetical protein
LAYASRAGGPVRNAFTPTGRAYGTPQGRPLPGQQQRFAVVPSNGGHAIELADNEAATVTVNEDGSLSIEVSHKPAPANGNSSNGNGNGVAVQDESHRSLRHRLRSGVAIVSRMSWTRDPSDGSVTFAPNEGETLDVSGDSVMAVVAAVPSSQPVGRPA